MHSEARKPANPIASPPGIRLPLATVRCHRQLLHSWPPGAARIHDSCELLDFAGTDPLAVPRAEDHRVTKRARSKKIPPGRGRALAAPHQIMLLDLTPDGLAGGRPGRNRPAAGCAGSVVPTSGSIHHRRPAGQRLAWSRRCCGFWRNRL